MHVDASRACRMLVHALARGAIALNETHSLHSQTKTLTKQRANRIGARIGRSKGFSMVLYHMLCILLPIFKSFALGLKPTV
jgi:hypothetical protein